MNINLKLDIPLFNYPTLKVKTNLLLYPYFCTEDDVLNPFEDFNEDKNFIRKIIFDNSIRVMNKTKLIEKLGIVDEITLFSLRREYTICLSSHDVVKKLKADFVATLSRAKSLGDFSVRTTKKTDTIVLERILRDSRACILEYEDLIQEIESSRVVPRTFIKGISNPGSIESSGRLWWLSEMHPNIKDAYASSKYIYNNKKYKAGNFQIKEEYVPESRVEPEY